MATGRAARPAADAAHLPVGDPRARVHIAPVGFEVERVVDAIRRDAADRVYLLTRDGDDQAAPFVREVVRRLEATDPRLDVRVERTALWDVFGALGQIRTIFEREGRTDRKAASVLPIRVNVSTGTKITAIAGTLACMLWRGEPYYVQVSESWYTRRTPTVRSVNDVVRRVDPVGVYELRAPSRELVEVLEVLHRRGGTARKRELIRDLRLDQRSPEGGPRGPAPTPQAQHSRLRRRLDPLETRWGFVEVDPGGRARLTEQGRLAVALFGLPPAPAESTGRR